MNKLIYIADDDDNIRNLLKTFLEREGFHVTGFPTGDKLFEVFSNSPADLIILDVMMPGHDGFFILKEIRKTSNVPIIMLTAKESEMDYSIGITSGSDDYMIKPFSPSILIMRIKALFRRIELERSAAASAEESPSKLEFGDIYYSESKHAIMCGNNSLGLTEMEMDFMKYMLGRPEEAISREDFLDSVWGLDAETESRVVDETVRRLRRKLRAIESKVTINTVWGFGYQLGVVE